MLDSDGRERAILSLGGRIARSVRTGTGDRGLRRALLALCFTEITSWGVLYYAFFAMLALLTRTTGWPIPAVMNAFSLGAVVAAVAGVPVGRLLDRFGPRPVMTTGSMVGVVAVLALAAAPSLPWFMAAWCLVGLAQAMLLYPPAFAALTQWYGSRRVPALTIVSLAAGLAGTVFTAPTAAVADWLGWRGTYVLLAVLLGAVTIPLHALCLTLPWPEPVRRRARRRGGADVRALLRDRVFVFLIVGMALGAFGIYAPTTNGGSLLTSQGIDDRLAALLLGMVGTGQVLGRLGYLSLTRITTPRGRTVAVLVAGAATVAALAAAPPRAAILVTAAVLAGAAGGVYTLLQATAVSDRWGTRHFAVLNGVFSVPTTIAIATAPACIAYLAGWLGSYRAVFYLLAALLLASAALATATHVPTSRLPHGS
jgi:MFS family permease